MAQQNPTAIAEKNHVLQCMEIWSGNKSIARQGKINFESVVAATHFVAERGRETGFWSLRRSRLRASSGQT